MTLKVSIRKNELVLALGVYDAFSALIASQFNYKALYVSGAGIAYTKLGRSDVGLVSMTEVAESIRLIADRVDTPLIVDVDNVYGNALNVQRCIRLYESAGGRCSSIGGSKFTQKMWSFERKNINKCPRDGWKD